jgi:methylmalonyl-CoA/ethylmalonyl-CoA epimerase
MTIAEGSGLSALGQVALPVRDVERSTAFYRDALGLPFLFEVPERMAFFDCGGVRLMLAVPEGEASGTAGAVLYFRVEALEGAHRELVERGVEFVRPPHRVAELGAHELWMAFFRDPDGTLLALMSEVPESGSVRSAHGFLSGTVLEHGDLVSPDFEAWGDLG